MHTTHTQTATLCANSYACKNIIFYNYGCNNLPTFNRRMCLNAAAYLTQ